MISPARGLVFAVAGLVLVAACASTPRISVVRDPGADFAGYRTFAFYEPLGTDP